MNNSSTHTMHSPRFAPGRKPRLHLVLDLDQVLEARTVDPEDLCRLGNVLLAFPGLVTTIHTRLPCREALATLDQSGLRRPDHLLGDSGAEVCHRGERGDLVQDLEYRNWLASHGSARHPGTSLKAAAVHYLESLRVAPRPLVATGREDRDFALLRLADLCLVRPGTKPKTGGFPVSQATWMFLAVPGLAETLRILLAFVTSLWPRPARLAPSRADFRPPAAPRTARPGRGGLATATMDGFK